MFQRQDLKLDKEPKEGRAREFLVQFDASVKAEAIIADSDVLRFSV